MSPKRDPPFISPERVMVAVEGSPPESTPRPMKQKRSYATKLRKLGITTLICFAMLGIAEFSVRIFTRVNFLDNSHNLFVDSRFGSSRGNLVSGEAVSFGETIHTDENGFRTDPAFKDPKVDRSILFLGDSVGFGCGVPEKDTALGRLRRALPDWRVLNSSVIGYYLKDYKNVVDSFLPKHPEVKAVYVILCLNDVYDMSAVEIKKSLGQDPDKVAQDVASKAKRSGLLQAANDWLRSRSKLYLFLKNLVSDTSLRLFQYDLQMYKDSDAYFGPNMRSLTEIYTKLSAVGIPFKVVVLPYEAQLRANNADYLLPQRMITKYLDNASIPYIDATASFRAAPVASAALYLFGDAMHLSATGHGVLYDILVRDVQAFQKTAAPVKQ